VGIHGIRVDKPRQLEDALRDAFAQPGPALVVVRALRQEVAIPPRIALHEAAGFTLWATRAVLNGDASAVLEVARTNLRQLARE
jgi:pyruvate dehydrogenase (quinone)